MRIKKLVKCAFPAVIAGALLCGCVKMEYSEEEQDMIANYAADVVLRHDENYKNSYMQTTEEIPTTTEAPTFGEEVTVAPMDNPGSSDGQGGGTAASGVAGVESLTQAMALNGCNAEFLDYYVESQYPFENTEDAVFIMQAVENSKLLILKFRISNPTGNDIALNMMAGSRKYKGIVNEVAKTNAQLSLIMDALNTYVDTIPAGASKDLVLVFQLSSVNTKADVTSLVVEFTDEAGAATKVRLK